MPLDDAALFESDAHSVVISFRSPGLGRAVVHGAAILLASGQTASETLANPQPQEAAPSLYATQAEAEAAAKQHFHCSGAHRMGSQWMPCSEHPTAPAHQHH